MAVTHVGPAGTSLQILPGYPQKKRVGSLWEMEYRYWCAKASAAGLVPAAWAACPDDASLVCREVVISPHPHPTMVFVDVTYADPDGVTFPDEPDDVEYESDTEAREIPIEQATERYGYEIDEAIAKNQRTAVYYAITYSRTELVSAASSAWSEANIIGTVGDIEDPTDMVTPTAGKWMHTARARRSAGRTRIQIRDTWTYDDHKWRPYTTTTTSTTTTTTTTTA